MNYLKHPETINHARKAFSDGMPEIFHGEIIQCRAAAQGHVHRRLNSRQVQFMAIGGTIGTGLFVGIGSALTRAGPLSMLLGYSITGIGVFCMMQCLGEMVALLPLPGAIPQFGARFVDDALGFALGWNNWYSGSLAVCTDISAAALIIQYWNDSINPAAWVTLLVFLLTGLNVFAVEIFGEVEFVFSTVKIVTMVGLLVMSLVIDLGGGPNHDRLGFRYWKEPGAMKEYIATGDLGRFLGLFSTLITASFSYGGIEAVAVIAGEAENPRKNMPKAINRLFWRIIVFYVLGSLAVGVLVPYNDPTLLAGQEEGLQGAGAAPWVVAIQNANIRGLPSVINVVIVISAASASNQFVYVSSRYLYALAQLGQAPPFFLKCSKRGIPYYCVGATCLMMALTYLSVTSRGIEVFTWLSNITITSGFISWAAICVSYLRFHAGLKAQGIDRDTLPYKPAFQPYLVWICLLFFTITGLGCGFSVFIKGHWSVSGFLTYYLNIPIFILLYFAWKIIKRTKIQRAKNMDFFSGRSEIDAEDAERVEVKPTTMLGKVWAWIC